MKTSIVQYAGFLVPVGLWGLTTQIGQIVPHVDCGIDMAFTLSACILAILVSLLAVGAGAIASRSEGRGPGVHLGTLFWFGGLLFSFAIFLQGAAALLISPCER